MGPIKRVFFYIVTLAVTIIAALFVFEACLRHVGFGDPPLYDYDPSVGYALQPSQNKVRLHGCRVYINSLRMRSADTSKKKPPGVDYRVLVLGDSVPYGGSYIDQAEIFCSKAQRNLNSGVLNYEVLNAGVNAYGPQNIWQYVKKYGLFEADMVIVYLPWRDLHRPFNNFHILPFWSNSPDYALIELFRHATWALFGKMSKRWKTAISDYEEQITENNLEALKKLFISCEESKTPIFFFWSPHLNGVTSSGTDNRSISKKKFYDAIPRDFSLDLTSFFKKKQDVHLLFHDGCHYSKDGHEFVAGIITEFIRSHAESSVGKHK